MVHVAKYVGRYKKYVLIALLSLGLGAVAKVQSQGVFFQKGDVDELLEKADDVGQAVFIFFNTPYCHNCKWMLKRQFSDPVIGDLFNGAFVCGMVNTENKKGKNALARFGIEKGHTLVCITPEGGVLRKLSGPVDNYQIKQFAINAKEGYEWYMDMEHKLKANEYSYSELQTFLSLKPTYAYAEEKLDRVLVENPNLFYSPEVLATVQKYFKDPNVSSFEYLVSKRHSFYPPLDRIYYHCVYSVFRRYYDLGDDQVLLARYNQALAGQIEFDAVSDVMLKHFQDSAAAIKDKSIGIKIAKEAQDTTIKKYFHNLRHWLAHRAFDENLVRSEVFFLCDQSFFQNDSLKGVAQDMIDLMYEKGTKKFWVYYSDAYFQTTTGNMVVADGLLQKAITDIRKTEPYNVSLLRHFQIQRATIKP